jgi:acid stress-induced BolA-like protein IbaG/YrbA
VGWNKFEMECLHDWWHYCILISSSSKKKSKKKKHQHIYNSINNNKEISAYFIAINIRKEKE